MDVKTTYTYESLVAKIRSNSDWENAFSYLPQAKDLTMGKKNVNFSGEDHEAINVRVGTYGVNQHVLSMKFERAGHSGSVQPKGYDVGGDSHYGFPMISEIRFESPFMEAVETQHPFPLARHKRMEDGLGCLLKFLFLEIGYSESLVFNSTEFQIFRRICENIANNAKAAGKSPARTIIKTEDAAKQSISWKPFGVQNRQQTVPAQQAALPEPKRMRTLEADASVAEPAPKRTGQSNSDHQNVKPEKPEAAKSGNKPAVVNANQKATPSGKSPSALLSAHLHAQIEELQTITSKPPHTNSSLEELRVVDYHQGRRFEEGWHSTTTLFQNTIQSLQEQFQSMKECLSEHSEQLGVKEEELLSLRENLASAQQQLIMEKKAKEKAQAEAKATKEKLNTWKALEQNVLALAFKCPNGQAVADREGSTAPVRKDGDQNSQDANNLDSAN